ncbi:MAG: TolC family protein [candidate division KSB1 bacterium]|nr:TolC family protein [candidate division KSB1 bacterium]
MSKVGKVICLVALFWMIAPVAQAQQKPFTLEQCVQIALENNAQVLIAKRRVGIAQTNVASARSTILPRLSSSVSLGQFRSGPRTLQMDVPVGFDPETGRAIFEQREIVQEGFRRDNYSMRFSLNQTLFDFGQSINNIKSAAAARDATRYSFEDTRQNTIYQVHLRYYQLLKDLRLLEVFREAVRSSEEQLKRTQSMYEIGSVAQADVYRAQTTLGQDRINLLQQEFKVQNSRTALNVILGREADAPLEIVDIEEVTFAQEYTLEEALQIALENNPLIHRYKADMMAASYGAKAARARYLPIITGSLSYSRDNTDIQKVYSGFDKNYSVSFGINLSLNLFNGFNDAAAVERESLNYRIALENLKEQERQLRQRVQTALQSLEMWKQISEINQLNLRSAEEELRLAQERYRVGAGTLLELITAQVNLTRARATLVQAKYDAKVAEAELKAAMGILK